MKIEEAIIHAMDTSKSTEECKSCRDEHKQLAKWLQELKRIKDILGDDYDLDRLKVLVNQRMTMREEVAERFAITKNIPVDQLRNLVAQAPYWMCPVCVGCKGKTGDGKRTEFCKYPENTKLCEERQKRLLELAEADRDGRCVVLSCKRGDTLWTFCNYPQSKVYSFKVTDVSTLNGRTMFNTDILSVVDARDVGKTVFLTRESAEATLKGEHHEDPV